MAVEQLLNEFKAEQAEMQTLLQEEQNIAYLKQKMASITNEHVICTPLEGGGMRIKVGSADAVDCCNPGLFGRTFNFAVTDSEAYIAELKTALGTSLETIKTKINETQATL